MKQQLIDNTHFTFFDSVQEAKKYSIHAIVTNIEVGTICKRMTIFIDEKFLRQSDCFGLILNAKKNDYVTASSLLGSSAFRTLIVDLRPNLSGPVFVLASLEVGNALLLLSGLSFLGLGAQPPTAEWGSMVSMGAVNFDRWWVGLFPGLAILTAVLAFNFIGDSLRDALDPRTAKALRD